MANMNGTRAHARWRRSPIVVVPISAGDDRNQRRRPREPFLATYRHAADRVMPPDINDYRQNPERGSQRRRCP